MRIKRQIRHIRQFLQRENLHLILVWVTILVTASAVGISLVEPDMSLLNAVWWSIVTLTTVGYGDISPVTITGRIIAVVIMFFGIGLLGMLSATLATILISKRIRENKGMNTFTFKNHIILCEWNHKTKAILNELRADTRYEDTPIILIADIDEKPVDDANLFFIKGSLTEEVLERANLSQAKTVVILGDEKLDTTSRDAKVVLNTLTIESICPDVYTVVELVDEANARHCKRARADEIIVGSELSSHLIASATLNHGISHFVTELLSSQYGNELYRIPVPNGLVNLPFIDVLVKMKKEFNCIVLGVQKEQKGEFIANPAENYALDKDDFLIVISRERPDISS